MRTASAIQLDLLRDQIAANQMRRNRKHHRRLVFPAMDFRYSGGVARFRPDSGVQDADIEAEVGAQILRQRFQDSAIAAVTIDDGEIARRKAARDLAAKVAHQSGHSLNR